MEFELVKRRKSELFTQIMTDKYDGVLTPVNVVKEYRFYQREEKRLIKGFNGVI